MYSTSARTLAPVNRSSTNENVGPSTYVICNSPKRKQNYAPFLTGEVREPSFLTKLNTDAIYDVSSNGHIIRGGASMRNKAPRFLYKYDDLPAAPTLKPLSWIKKKLKLDPAKPKLYVCRVPYSVTCTSPSVPTKIDENGYDIDPDGNVIKVPPDEPEYIDLNITPTFPGRKGWRWSCRTSGRFSMKESSVGPGPAAYTLQIPKCRRSEEEELVREMARRFSFMPRYVEDQAMKVLREGLPGPGHYDFPKPPSDRAKSIYPRPFISKARRFKGRTESDTPAPNKYELCNCYGVRKHFTMKCAPFGVEAPRFRRKREDVLPGPGDYEIKSALREKLDGKKNPHALFQPPFSTTQERKSVFLSPNAEWMPSPADYSIDGKDGEEEMRSSVFVSTVERFGVLTGEKVGVSPTRYDVAAGFEKTRSRKCFSAAELPFCSSGPRSSTPAVKTDAPCPTSYRNERGLGDAGYHFGTSPRFEAEAEDRPGPGSYSIHPRFEVATYKAWDTHNLKLKENVLRKRLKLAPRETRRQWKNQLKKRKLLKWFDVGVDFEERLVLLIHKLFDEPV